MTKTICFHHDDADGQASAAVVRYALGPDVALFEADYDDRPIPWNEVEKSEKIIVTDFSFPPEIMQRFAQGRDLIWIDHHKSAIAELGEIAKDWKGLQSTEESACVLAWKYFFPERPVPKAIILIGDRDIWRWAEPETGDFNEGLYAQDMSAKNDDLWRSLLDGDPALLEKLITAGHQRRILRLKEIKRTVDGRGFEIMFEGLRTLAINVSGNGDIGQYGRECGYELVYCYFDKMQKGTLATFVTLFSEVTDVSVIARRFGGGGHSGAAGFSFSREVTPFPPSTKIDWGQSRISPNQQEKKIG